MASLLERGLLTELITCTTNLCDAHRSWRRRAVSWMRRDAARFNRQTRLAAADHELERLSFALLTSGSLTYDAADAASRAGGTPRVGSARRAGRPPPPIRLEKSADFRGRLTCLFHTQFPPRTVRFFLVFLAFERRDMGAL